MYIHYLNMLCACYRDIASAFPAQNTREHALDLRTIVRRFEHEGIEFLTKSLPAYGKAIDLALSDRTRVLNIPNFQKKKGTELPLFMGWLLREVFCDSGVEQPSPLSMGDTRRRATALSYLRQISYLFYKLEMPYDQQSINRVLRDFVETDTMVGNQSILGDPRMGNILHYAGGLVGRVLGGVSPLEIIPKHGPGSVATGEKAPMKSYFKRDYVEATRVYPLDSHFYFNSSHVERCLASNGLMVRDERGRLRPWKTMEQSTAKVVLVPKDSRGPRLISMEPLEIQWLQQGQCELLVRSIESHWLTKGHVNFANQGINRFLAWLSSMPPLWRSDSELSDTTVAPEMEHLFGVGGLEPLPACAVPSSANADLVTLDMKEASDRVSLAHLGLFPRPWIEALMATRSSHTVLPNGVTVELNKFAPMGSAVCFPTEAIIFWAISVAAIRYDNPTFNSRNDSKKLLKDLAERVWVYGDDLIIHREDYPGVKSALEQTGLLLNASKCCLGDLFRESCGFDSYGGFEVTPLRIKQCLRLDHMTGQQLMSYVSYSNEAYRRGYHELANYLQEVISNVVSIPFTTVDQGFVQFVRPDANVRALNRQWKVRVRFNPNTHVLEAYGPAPRAVVTSNHNVTWEAYANKFLSSARGGELATPPTTEKADRKISPISGKLGADQYSVPRRVTSHRGWKQITV